MSQELSLQSVLNRGFRSHMDNVYTAIPAIVVRVRDGLSRNSIDVQPAINILKEDGTSSPRTTTLNVPLSMPVNREGGLTHPIRAGESVLLLFSMAGIDRWKRGSGELNDPTDFRRFDKKDCVAVPIQTLPNCSNDPTKHSWPHSTDDVVMFHNLGTGREVEVRLKMSGDVVVNTNQSVTVNAGTAVTVNTSSATLNADTLVVNCPQTTWTGDISLAGDITQTGNTGVTGNFSVSGDSTMTGSISQSGNYTLDGVLTINGTVFEDHQHSGVSSGSGNTGGVV